jgi:putative membrane protein
VNDHDRPAAWRLWFAPDRLRTQGTTPDYRFSLANERTFLAWIRTALALVGGGLAADQFLTGLERPVRTAIAVVLLAGGALCAVRAVSHWVRCELAMRRGEDLPSSRFPTLLAVGTAVAAVVLLGTVVLGGAGR